MEDGITREVLRSPGDLRPLRRREDGDLESDDDRVFPVLEGILCLLDEAERGADLGDAGFYDEHPFGERDWSDPSDVEAGVESDLKSLLAEYPSAALILDAGAGTGRISNYLSRAGYGNVISLDYSLPSLRVVRRHSDNTCVWGNILRLPVQSGTCDLVISSGVIHHTPDPALAVRECARALKPGGRLYLRTYNSRSIYGALYHTYGALLRSLEGRPGLGALVELGGFKPYALARRLLRRDARQDDRVLRAKFANLFTKRLVHFFGRRDIDRLVRDSGLLVERYERKGFTHRMHCHVARKPA